MSALLSSWLKSLAVTVPALAASAILVAQSGAQNAPPKEPPAAGKDAARDLKDSAKDAAKDTKDAAKDVVKDAKEAAKDVKDTAKDTTKEARDDVRDATRDARDNVRDARENARENFRDTRDNVREQARDTQDKVRDPRDPKDPARDQSRDARDPESVRQPNRDDRRDTRDDRNDRDVNVSGRFSAQGTRAADIGLWFERDTSKGLVISDVGTRGAIAKLGFHEGDRIVSINGQKVTREDDFITYLFADDMRTQKVQVIVVRDGREQVIVVEPTVFIEELSYVENDPLEHFGVIVDDRYNDRIVVWRVVPRSPAYYAGIRAGDVIVSLGNQRLANVAAFVQRLTGADAGELQVQVNRGQATRTLHVDVPRFVGRTERRTSLRPNIDERRDDRLDRRDDRIDDRQDRRDDRRDAPRLPTKPAPVAPPAAVPARPTTPAPASGNPAPRTGLFPRGSNR